MKFTFNEDQQAFRDSISKFLMVEAAPERLREIWQTGSGRSAELREKMAAQGITALSVPETYGGLGLGDVDWTLMTQELGYFAIPDSLADTAYVAAGLLAALPQGHIARETWLPRIADGSCRVAVGHPVNGWVADAHLADLLLLLSCTSQGVEWHGLDPSQVTLVAIPSIHASRRLATVRWTPTAGTCLISGSAAQLLAAQVLNRGALNVSGLSLIHI